MTTIIDYGIGTEHHTHEHDEHTHTQGEPDADALPRVDPRGHGLRPRHGRLQGGPAVQAVTRVRVRVAGVLAPELLGAIAVAAYAYMALVPLSAARIRSGTTLVQATHAAG